MKITLHIKKAKGIPDQTVLLDVGSVMYIKGSVDTISVSAGSLLKALKQITTESDNERAAPSAKQAQRPRQSVRKVR